MSGTEVFTMFVGNDIRVWSTNHNPASSICVCDVQLVEENLSDAFVVLQSEYSQRCFYKTFYCKDGSVN